MKKQARTARLDRMARVYDQEILPVWSQRFGRMILRDLEPPPKAMVLDVACATGYSTLEVLRRLDDQSRVVAIDPFGPLLDVARRKAGALGGKRILFRTEPLEPRLPFTDEVYDLSLCNLGLDDVEDREAAVRELARVTKTGGAVIATLALEGTWVEFFDIYREVLIKHDLRDALARLDAHRARYVAPETAVGWLEKAGLGEVSVDVETFTLLFRSSREFFFAPLIEFGPLSEWKEVAGSGRQMQDVFWYIKDAIDAYFGKRAFSVSVVAGCVRGRRGSSALSAPAEVRRAPESHEEIEVITGEVAIESVIPLDEPEDETPLAALEEASEPRKERSGV